MKLCYRMRRAKEMKPKLFIATYFKDYKSAFKYAAKQNKIRGRKVFEVITNKQGFFVVSQAVLRNCFWKRKQELEG